MDLTVRWARAAEASVVHRILSDAYKQYEGKIFPPFAVFETEAVEIARHIRFRRHRYALALAGKEPVGTLRCTPLRRPGQNPRWVLSRLAVLPAYQGRGVAAELIRWMHRAAEKAGVAELRGDVRTALPALLRFYKRFGYNVVGFRSKPGYPRYLAVVGLRLQ